MSVAGVYLGAFLLLLGILVFIHELGHFIVAKLFGVKVERFSLGFGPALFERRVGETEYRIALLPLGGYVKMLGELPGEELPEAERHRSFTAQPVGRRIWIALAGPAMNLLLPVLVIAGMAMTGLPRITSLIGAVRPASPAERAGLRGGDRVVAIDGRAVWRWEDLADAVAESGGRSLELEVERAGQRRTVVVVPKSDPDGGLVLGVEPSAQPAILGLPDADGVAALAGLRTGDRVVRVDGRPVADRYAFEVELAAVLGPLRLEVERVQPGGTERIRVELRAGSGPWSLERMGAIPVDFSVFSVDPGSPARKAGLQPGDLLVRIDGTAVRSFQGLADRIRGSEGAALPLLVLRDGLEIEVEVVPKMRAVQREGRIETVLAIGIRGGPPLLPAETRDEIVWNPLRALWMGTVRTTEIVALTLDGIWQLVTGKVGVENLAGPIGIGKFAGDYFREKGWHPYLNLLALISVNLAILNLLPIPVLDGGQILLALVELLRGGPISVRAREIAQTIGLSFILLLMSFAFWNDIQRHWDDFVGFFKGLV